MSSNRPDEPAFSWPPDPADLERIDVLDVTSPARVPALASASRVIRRLHRGASRRARPHTRTRARVTARDGWLLLASGVLIGATLAGIMRTHTLAVASHQGAPAAGASPTAGPSSEGVALRAMQAMLRGDLARAAQPASSALRAVQSGVRVGPAAEPAPTLRAQALSVRARGEVEATSSAPTALEAHALTTAAPVAPSRAPVPGSPSRRAVSRPSATAVAARANTNAREQPVRRVLEAYERAWTRMDSYAARALWPSADAGALQAAFTPVSEQRLKLAACDIGVSGDRALATCLGTLRYRPRGGDGAPRVTRGRWEFALERSPRGWQISTVDQPRRAGP